MDSDAGHKELIAFLTDLNERKVLREVRRLLKKKSRHCAFWRVAKKPCTTSETIMSRVAIISPGL